MEDDKHGTQKGTHKIVLFVLVVASSSVVDVAFVVATSVVVLETQSRVIKTEGVMK
jgi:hypothetical protein